MSVRTALAVLFTLVTSSVAPAQTLTTVFKNGPSTNRVDVVVLGDGYTSAELPKFASDVQQFVVAMFAQQPFREYRPFFNVYRIDIASLESGADHPESNSFKNTAFDATYNCAFLHTICVANSKVLDAASASALPSQRDVILVLVNDATYGGSGGPVAVSSTHPSGVEIVLHELGHSFGLLADEYGGPAPPGTPCDSSIEPVEANATKTVTGPLKWGAWIAPQTPIPTPGAVLGVPGLYEGARYCDTGLFRPTYDSKMRSLFMPFEQINREQLVKRYYSLVSPIQSYSPSSATITIRKGRARTFKVTTVRPATHTLVTRWSVDGVAAASGASFLLDSSNLSLGQHSVRVVSRDPTAMVRSDPSSALKDIVHWLLKVLPSRCDISADGSTNVVDVQRLVNQILGISPSISDLNSDGQVNVVDLQIVVNVALGVYACPADS